MLDALSQADLGERTAKEVARAHQAAIEDGRRAACDANIPFLEHLEREDRGVGQVPQFVGEESEPLAPTCGFSIERRLISPAPILGDRARDGIIQTMVQSPKV